MATREHRVVQGEHSRAALRGRRSIPDRRTGPRTNAGSREAFPHDKPFLLTSLAAGRLSALNRLQGEAMNGRNCWIAGRLIVALAAFSIAAFGQGQGRGQGGGRGQAVAQSASLTAVPTAVQLPSVSAPVTGPGAM